MTMTAPPAKTAISDVYPNPTNAVARTGFGALWDYVTGLLGSTGFTSGMLSASKILDPQALYNVSLVPSVAGNALTMKLTSGDGSTVLAAGNPATVAQRSSTVTSGTYNLRNITGDLTLVISSGSTLGHVNGTAGFIYWYLIDNAGTQELAASTKDFGNGGIVSTTAEGGAGAADSATVMYSATARSNVPFHFIGRTTDSQATAGTWTAVPTLIEMAPLNTSAATIIAKAKASGQSVTTNTTLQNDADLSFSIGANETWVADFWLNVGSALPTTGIKVGVTVPAGGSQSLVAHVAGGNSTSGPIGIISLVTASGQIVDTLAGVWTGATSALIHVKVWMANGATPGTVQLQWAQSTSSGTALTLFQGCYMVAHKI